MSEIKRRWDKLPDEEKKAAKEELIQFFENERDEKIGLIAADELLNFFLASIGGKLYNMGIRDAKKAIENRQQELQFDLEDLMA